MPGHESEAQRVPPEGSLKELGKDIVLTKRMLQHATQLALAEDNQQAEMEKWNLSQVEKAMKEKKQSESNLSDNPEEYMNQQRGWWDAQLAEWSGKRLEVKHEMERRALDRLLATQNPDQLSELQDPHAAKQWLQLMEASLHPFISQVNKDVTAPPGQVSPPRSDTRVPVPTQGEWAPRETKNGLWSTLPKSTEQFVETRKQNLLRPDWSKSFSSGNVGAQGQSKDRYWDTTRSVQPPRQQKWSDSTRISR